MSATDAGDEDLIALSNRFVFDGAHLPSGTYLVRADGETFGESFRVVLVK